MKADRTRAIDTVALRLALERYDPGSLEPVDRPLRCRECNLEPLRESIDAPEWVFDEEIECSLRQSRCALRQPSSPGVHSKRGGNGSGT